MNDAYEQARNLEMEVDIPNWFIQLHKGCNFYLIIFSFLRLILYLQRDLHHNGQQDWSRERHHPTQNSHLSDRHRGRSSCLITKLNYWLHCWMTDYIAVLQITLLSFNILYLFNPYPANKFFSKMLFMPGAFIYALQATFGYGSKHYEPWSVFILFYNTG